MASRHQHRRPRERLPKPTRVLAISGSRPDLALSPEQKMALHNEELARWEIRHVATHNPPAIWAQSASRSGALRPGCHALGLWTGQVPRYVDRRHRSIRDAVTRAQFERGVDRRLAEWQRLVAAAPAARAAVAGNRRHWAGVQFRVCHRVRLEAQDPGTPVSRLATLAKVPWTAVRRAVAHNANTPLATLTLLAADADGGVRREVATNPASPIEALRALARRPDTPAEILARLASDRRANIRRWAAKNAATPAAAVETLASDPRPSVRAAALVALARTGWGAAALVVGGKPDGAWTPPVETRRHLRVVESDREGELRHVVTD